MNDLWEKNKRNVVKMRIFHFVKCNLNSSTFHWLISLCQISYHKKSSAITLYHKIYFANELYRYWKLLSKFLIAFLHRSENPYCRHYHLLKKVLLVRFLTAGRLDKSLEIFLFTFLIDSTYYVSSAWHQSL